jgi:hypothetical protein
VRHGGIAHPRACFHLPSALSCGVPQLYTPGASADALGFGSTRAPGWLLCAPPMRTTAQDPTQSYDATVTQQTPRRGARAVLISSPIGSRAVGCGAAFSGCGDRPMCPPHAADGFSPPRPPLVAVAKASGPADPNTSLLAGGRARGGTVCNSTSPVISLRHVVSTR